MTKLTGLNGGQVNALHKAWGEADNLRSLTNTVYWDDREMKQEAHDAADKFTALCARYGIDENTASAHFTDLLYSLGF